MAQGRLSEYAAADPDTATLHIFRNNTGKDILHSLHRLLPNYASTPPAETETMDGSIGEKQPAVGIPTLLLATPFVSHELLTLIRQLMQHDVVTA